MSVLIINASARVSSNLFQIFAQKENFICQVFLLPLLIIIGIVVGMILIGYLVLSIAELIYFIRLGSKKASK